jgi:dienelactone hydrolase
MQTEEFSLPISDGTTQIRGDVISPDGLQEPTGTLLMIPGGGFTERDGFLGDSYTGADLMFRRIAHRVVNAGLVVTRYDNRGVTGHELSIGLTKNSSDQHSDPERYFASCVDFVTRQTVTAESLLDDAALVYQFVSEHPNVDPSRIVVFAHSGAGIHVCRLIGSNRINPTGIVLAGTPVGSPIEILRWQMIDRYVGVVMSWDRDGDGNVSVSDVTNSYGDSYFIEVGLIEDDLTPANGQWSKLELIAFFTERYEEDKTKALATPDEAAYPPAEDDTRLNYVLASNRWWKRWFLDGTSSLELLRKYTGHLAFHFGEIDRQFSSELEVARVADGVSSLSVIPNVTLHPGRGHAFDSSKPLAGPMDNEAEEMFVQEITAMIQST